MYKLLTMKKLLLLLMIQSLAFAQPDVEIRLVNQNIGSPLYGSFQSASSSNDAGLNAILQTYNVYSYINKYGHPYEPYSPRIISILGSFPQQFINDLLAYSSVVEYARVSEMQTFSDALELKIINLNVGIPTGFNGNIVTTNDTGLNQIFQNFNVYYYVQSYPTSTWNTSLRVFQAACNCDKNSLRAALDNYTTVIESTENISAVYLLSNNNFETSKTYISPNPFSYNFEIQTTQTITNYSIIDITGKTIISTSSKSELDNQSSQLSAGIYILNLNFDNGLKAIYKLVKK